MNAPATQPALMERYLQKARAPFTLNDAASQTGLSTDTAREVLMQMVEKYACRLKVTENGDLIYDFGPALHRRGAKTAAEYAQQVGEWLWKAFTFAYKVWITLMLVVYFALFVGIMIAMLIVAFSSNNNSGNNNRKSGSSLGAFHLVNGLFRALFSWKTFQGNTRYATDKRGYPYRAYQPSQSVLKPESGKKNFVASVYDFVFGPPRFRPDSLANAREIAAYLREQKGVLATTEIVGLTGMNLQAAEEQFSDAIVRYNGLPRIREEDALLYADFPELIRSQSREQDEQIVWYWDEYEPPYQLTGNTAFTNTIVVGMNLFNLVFALFAWNQLQNHGYFFAFQGQLWEWVLGAIPVTFSVIFFAIPLFRWMATLNKERQRHASNIRKRVLKVLFRQKNTPMTPAQIAMAANQTANMKQAEEKLSEAQVQSTLNTLINEYEGETIVTEAGTIAYTFPRLWRELDGIATVRGRLRRDNTQSLGSIAFEGD